MPRNAAATMPAGPTPLEELLDRGHSQGHLSLDEVRSAFQEAGITPTQGRSIIRELADAASTKKKGTATVKKAKPTRAKSSAKTTGGKTKATAAKTAEVEPEAPAT